MAVPQIPDDVLRFISDEIDTVPHLEALLLVWESAPATWSADDIASRTYVRPDVAAKILRDLKDRGFVASAGAHPQHYAYDADRDREAQLVPRVAAVYRRHLIPIAKMIHAKGSPAVRAFAEAFNVRKDR